MQLSKIKDPSDIRRLTHADCIELADDLRTKIIQTVSQNGGHLSSNLGIVEITMALHRVFQTPRDKIIFDVGHQTYAHKLLTGRYEQFGTLRTLGGISGFPKCSESIYDCFETGHASTAVSAALGMARARDELRQDFHIVAVLGDGALTGGICYEALNDCGNGQDKIKLIIVLNDNEMSIAQNVGALSSHLSQLRASAGWNTTKRKVKSGLNKIPILGAPLKALIHSVKKSVKSFFVDEGFFSSLGFRYLGPIDGHDLPTLEKILHQAKQFDEPVVVHCITKKGYGYYGAERKPEKFHGIPPFLIESGEITQCDSVSNGCAAADTLVELAGDDPRIVAVTAAMPMGTGTDRFRSVFPNRFFDVGIAEEHAVTMCAGMAKGGLKPFFFVYSTFLQRAYDQVFHDICMQHLPVTLMLDRAGLANEDGQTHQGLYDFAYLRHIPGITLLAPADRYELKEMIRFACGLDGPCAIRYPKNSMDLPGGCQQPFVLSKWQLLRQGMDGVILAVGSMVLPALRAAEALYKEGMDLEVVNASTIKPLDKNFLRMLGRERKPVFTLEEHTVIGGFGSAVIEYQAEAQLGLTLYPMGVKDQFIPHGDHESLLQYLELDRDSLRRNILRCLQKTENPHE